MKCSFPVTSPRKWSCKVHFHSDTNNASDHRQQGRFGKGFDNRKYLVEQVKAYKTATWNFQGLSQSVDASCPWIFWWKGVSWPSRRTVWGEYMSQLPWLHRNYTEQVDYTNRSLHRDNQSSLAVLNTHYGCHGFVLPSAISAENFKMHWTPKNSEGTSSFGYSRVCLKRKMQNIVKEPSS